MLLKASHGVKQITAQLTLTTTPEMQNKKNAG
jgi:hypothetical protein